MPAGAPREQEVVLLQSSNKFVTNANVNPTRLYGTLFHRCQYQLATLKKKMKQQSKERCGYDWQNRMEKLALRNVWRVCTLTSCSTCAIVRKNHRLKNSPYEMSPTDNGCSFHARTFTKNNGTRLARMCLGHRMFKTNQHNSHKQQRKQMRLDPIFRV